METSKKYDITVFGATGFTGELTAFYLAEKQKKENFTLAIAGRDEIKLNQLKKKIESKFIDSKIEVIRADVKNYLSLLEMTRLTKNLITTVGPYLEHGENVLRASIEESCNYFDLTGEGKFVFDMEEIYGSKAKEKKVKIINCCGFDSIPADLGAYYTVSQLKNKDSIEVECFVNFQSGDDSLFGGFNSVSGGTWHSALGIMSGNDIDRQKKSFERIQKNSPSRKISPIPLEFRLRDETKTYGAPLPFVDVEVVLRSAADLEIYGSDFKYGHFAGIKSTPTLIGSVLGIGLIYGLAQFEPTRNLLKSFRKQGEGPDPELREKNRYELSFYGRSKSEFVQILVKGKDPGYGDTSKMLGESALCILKDNNPEKYGFITPAIAMGENLINRLNLAGIEFIRIR